MVKGLDYSLFDLFMAGTLFSIICLSCHPERGLSSRRGIFQYCVKGAWGNAAFMGLRVYSIIAYMGINWHGFIYNAALFPAMKLNTEL